MKKWIVLAIPSNASLYVQMWAGMEDKTRDIQIYGGEKGSCVHIIGQDIRNKNGSCAKRSSNLTKASIRQRFAYGGIGTLEFR